MLVKRRDVKVVQRQTNQAFIDAVGALVEDDPNGWTFWRGWNYKKKGIFFYRSGRVQKPEGIKLSLRERITLLFVLRNLKTHFKYKKLLDAFNAAQQLIKDVETK